MTKRCIHILSKFHSGPFGVSLSRFVLFAGPPTENNLDSSSPLKHFHFFFLFSFFSFLFFFCLFFLVQVDSSHCRVLLLRSTFQIPPIFQAGQSNAFASPGLAALLYSRRENPHISEQKRQHSSHQLDVMVLFSPRRAGSAASTDGGTFLGLSLVTAQ